MPFAPLLAVEIFDVVRAIILFVILAGGVARLFVDAKGAQNKAPGAPQRPKPGGPPPNPQQEAMRAEVDEFLRRAGRDRAPEPRLEVAEARPAPPAPRPPRIEVIEEPTIEVERKQRSPSPPPRRKELELKKKRAVESGMSAAGERPNFGGTTDALGSNRIRTQLSDRAAELGYEIRQQDERFEARIQEKFEHQLGTLGGRQREAAENLRKELSRTTLADDLMKMLSSPAGVRQALVLSEILNRPTDRWS